MWAHTQLKPKRKKEKKHLTAGLGTHKIPLSTFLLPLKSSIYNMQQGVLSAPDS